MDTGSYRKLTDYERAVLARLLEVDFAGRQELKEQIQESEVKLVETGDNYGTIEFKTSSDTKAAVNDRVPVMAMTKDDANADVSIMLHVADGKIHQLEFVRLDGEPMQGLPNVERLRIVNASEVRSGEIKGIE